MTGKFKCKNESCKKVFEHTWYGGDINNRDSHSATQCKFCNHPYVDWLNYKEMFEKK